MKTNFRRLERSELERRKLCHHLSDPGKKKRAWMAPLSWQKAGSRKNYSSAANSMPSVAN